jgi:uncharacterized membrane protein YhhN
LLGHLCYIITFLECLGFFGFGGGSLNITALAVSIPPVFILGLFAFRLVKPPREMTVPVIVYMIALECVVLLGLQVFIISSSFAGALVFFGCLLFLASDTILSYYTFRKLKLLGAVFIMVFYIMAQAGIILGLINL